MNNDSLFLNLDNYEKMDKLGKGSFGKVYRVKNIDTGDIYAAKVLYDENDFEEEEELIFLYREIKILSALNHPSIIRFIGYSPTDFQGLSKFTILTEFAQCNTLRSIIECENSSTSPHNWDETRKLICIYGIAHGMSYLHKNEVIHRDLKTDNILMDEYLCPKIADFGLSKVYNAVSKSMRIQSKSGQMGTPCYMAPEIFSKNQYSKSSDVYAFAMIVYEIVSGYPPFKGTDMYNLLKKLVNKERPIIPSFVPPAYSQLIEKCWSQDPKDRPSFDEIVEDLKSNTDFITDLVDENDFLVYRDFLEDYKSTFDFNNSIHFDSFIKKKETGFKRMSVRIKNEKIVEILEEDKDNKTRDDNNNKIIEYDKTSDEETNDNDDDKNIDENKVEVDKTNDVKKKTIKAIKTSDDEEINDDDDNDKNSDKTNGNKKNSINKDVDDDESVEDDDVVFFPYESFENLAESCKRIVREAEKSRKKKFIVGKNLIEGKSNFPLDVQLGIKYLQKSRSEGSNDSRIYLAKMFIDGEIVPNNYEEARKIISEVDSFEDDGHCLYLLGRIEKKKKNYLKAKEFFQQSSQHGNADAMFEYGELLMEGYDGIDKDEETANKYFQLAINNGCKKVYKPDDSKPKTLPKNHETKKSDKKEKNDSKLFSIKNSKPKKIKVVFVGDKGIGKNALIFCIEKGEINGDYVPTVIDNYVVKITYRGSTYNVQMWDTSWQEDLENIRVLSYTNTDIFVLVYSLINKQSLYNIENMWYDEILQYREIKNVGFILAGVDLEKWDNNSPNPDFVTQEEIDAVANKINANKSVKCSYKTYKNIEEVSFFSIIEVYNSVIKASQKQNKDLQIKVLCVGNEESRISQFLNSFKEADFQIKNDSYDSVQFNVSFLSVKSAFKRISESKSTDANVILLLFSLYNNKGFSDVQNFWEKIPKKYVKKATFLLIGLEEENNDEYAIDEKQVDDFAQIIGYSKLIHCSSSIDDISNCKEQIVAAYLMKNDAKACTIF